MRTTLDIPEELVKEAMTITGAKTKSQLISNALTELINRVKRHRLLKYKGKLNLDVDLDATRDRA